MEEYGSLEPIVPIVLDSAVTDRKNRPGRLVMTAVLFACMCIVTLPPARAGPLNDAEAALAHGDGATAQRIYRSLADRGDVVAMTRLGLMYRAGQGVPRDYREALRWLDRAAALGSAEAQYQMGDMHLRGLGTDQDLLQAARYYSRAAEQGHAKAQYVLGIQYKFGGGVAKNHRKAARWFGRSAAQGLPEAQVELGQLYASGLGVPKDYVAAYKWLTLARNNTSSSRTRSEATDAQRQLQGRIRPAQIADAINQARSWRPVPEG